VVLSKNIIENMLLQIMIIVTTSFANSITPLQEVRNFKTILAQSSEAVQMSLGLLAGDSKHREDI
jgi:ABC-type glucose/galactose transport system permease subunit